MTRRDWSACLGIWVLLGCGGQLLGEQPAAARVGAAGAGAEAAGPLAPEAAQRAFRLEDDRLEIQLVAAEPAVQDPVAVHFDEEGRPWVVEMGDYPHGPAAGEQPRSRIKVLQDGDGDGRYESATVFADQLLFATELQPWKGGVIATLAGQVVYLRDSDGDGRADQREVWYEGFAQENSQLRANHPRLSLDGWVYVSNGLRGGTVRDARHSDSAAIPLAGKDFRFHPTTGAYEAITGVGQFGLTFDDFGNRFICSNRNPLMHVVLEDRYIRRNPHYAPSTARHDVGLAGEASRIYALSRAWTTSNLHAGQFTAACGVVIFRGTGLPVEWHGNGFTCDPTGNLVHRESVEPRGATFRGRVSDRPVEFLASPDEWFRPVNLANGPDGALYVVDMYRAVIEHPDFMPDELKQRPDLRLGTDRGRIWRVVSRQATRARPPRLSGESSAALVAKLEAPGWVGDTAFRLLYERQDGSASAELHRVARQGSPAGATRALWLLQHLGALDDDQLDAALRSSDSRIREQAVRLAELRGTDPRWRRRIAGLGGDSDPRVRFQVALSLAPVQTPEEAEAVRQIALAGAQDEWARRAVAIAVGERASDLASALLPAAANLVAANAAEANVAAEASLADGVSQLLRELFGIVAAQKKTDSLQSLLSAICRLEGPGLPAAFRQELLLAFAESLGRSGASLAGLASKLDRSDRERLDQVFERARSVLRDGTSLAARGSALQLLGFDERYVADLTAFARRPAATDTVPTELRVQALSALARQPRLELWRELMADWPSESPAVRRRLLDLLLARPDRTELLLGAIENGVVKPSELESSVSSRLLKHGQPALRARAEKLLASLIPADRQQVLADYQQVLTMKSDPLRGREVFGKQCATCHRIGDIGVNVAPDISDSRVKRPEQLLTDILQPNRAIDNNYLSYTIVTGDGLTATGVIASETGTSITLRQQEGKESTFLRSNVEELRSNGVSLMPEGLEQTIPRQDMADLIAFIKNWRYLDGRTPLIP